MTVLSYPDGKPLNWDAIAKDPDRVSKMVQWSKRSNSGKVVRGSLFFIAALDTMDQKAQARFGAGVNIIQTAWNTGVDASEGTHDYDAVIDWEIPGIYTLEAQSFGRFYCGMATWARTPAQGFPWHNHGFFLPPGGHVFPTKVGKYIDGGKSLGISGFSSQIADYWVNALGLEGQHAPGSDPTPFPSKTEKMAGIFDLDRYIQKQREATMEFKDWSPESQQMCAKMTAAEVIKQLDTVRIVERKDPKNVLIDRISLVSAVQRILNR